MKHKPLYIAARVSTIEGALNRGPQSTALLTSINVNVLGHTTLVPAVHWAA